jgi:hypothetical protein
MLPPKPYLQLSGHWQEWLTFIVRLFFFFPSPGKQPTPCIFPATSDSKTDSKTGGQQWISVDEGGNSIGLWRGWKTLVDLERRGVPKGGLGTMNVPVVWFDQIFRLAILLM